jgi:hypothetical protein
MKAHNMHTNPTLVSRPNLTRRYTLLALSASMVSMTGCAMALGGRADTPFVVRYDAAPGSTPKTGLMALTDSGKELFASSTQTERNGGENAFGGTIKLPQWVQVTWRKDITTDYWTTGTVIGNHRVEVMSRIPEEVFQQLKAGPKRVLKLHFLVKDDEVLFAWSIVLPDKIDDLLHGGDFKLPKRDNGKVIDQGYGWQK